MLLCVIYMVNIDGLWLKAFSMLAGLQGLELTMT